MPIGANSAADRPKAFPAFRAVRLLAPQRSGFAMFPKGTRGAVVGVYADGTYGVEFSTPVEDVAIVSGRNLAAA